MDWVKGTVKLVYDPVRRDLRKEERNTPWWLVGELIERVPGDFTAYYRWILFRRGIGMHQGLAWLPHVTILDGRRPVKDEYLHLWKKYDGKIVNIEYGTEVEKIWKFWCLPVRCEFFKEIRKELGFNPNYPFHITIAREYEIPKKEEKG